MPCINGKSEFILNTLSIRQASNQYSTCVCDKKATLITVSLKLGNACHSANSKSSQHQDECYRLSQAKKTHLTFLLLFLTEMYQDVEIKDDKTSLYHSVCNSMSLLWKFYIMIYQISIRIVKLIASLSNPHN